MNALRSPKAAPRICFQGVEQASPFGILLGSSVSALATVSGHGRAVLAPKQWMATVLGSSLQWWEAKRSASASSRDQDAADIAVDFFGCDLVGVSAGRFWRVVDDSGEPILNPFCFLERCNRAPFVASIFLVERAADGRGWTVIGEAHISSCWRYRDLLNRVGHVAAHLMASPLGENGYATARRWDFAPRIPTRSRTQVAAGLLRARFVNATMTVRHAACNERWAIGVLNAPVDSLTRSQVLRADSWILSPSRDAYLADPFPWPGQSNMFLCERYDYRTRLGMLRAVTFDRGKVSNEEAVDLNVGGAHLSYPFTYREHERTFLLPEMAAFRKLILFELLSETKARAVCVIDRGTPIADPTLFKHDGFYWIAYTDLAIGTDDNLCLLYSSQLEGPWVPHHLNPVKIDIRSSRPGGTPFLSGGKLYRPAQDCSTTYGATVALNLVRICTPDYYEEETVAVLRPHRRGPFPHGLHTLSIDGSRIFFDGKKLFFDLHRFSKWMKEQFLRSGRAR